MRHHGAANADPHYAARARPALLDHRANYAPVIQSSLNCDAASYCINGQIITTLFSNCLHWRPALTAAVRAGLARKHLAATQFHTV